MKECNMNLDVNCCNQKCENTKTIVKEIESDYFPGFYHSIFSHPDEFEYYEQEDKNELEAIIGDNVNVYYEYIKTEEYDGWKEYKKDVSKAFLEGYIEAIKDALPYKITDHENFLLETNTNNMVVASPKYYNYSTDRCWCDIITNMKTLQMIKEHTLKRKYAKEYIFNAHSSYDGKISLIDNNINYWNKLPISEYEDNMLTALFDALIVLSYLEDKFDHYKSFADLKIEKIIKAYIGVDTKIRKIKEINNKVEEDVRKIYYNEAFHEINISVAEDYSQICYAEPIISYKGKEYKMDEFKKIFGKEL